MFLKNCSQALNQTSYFKMKNVLPKKKKKEKQKLLILHFKKFDGHQELIIIFQHQQIIKLRIL